MCLQKRPIEWEDVVRRSGTDDHCSFVDLCGTSKRRSGFAYHRVKRGTERNLKARIGYGSAELDVVWKQVRPPSRTPPAQDWPRHDKVILPLRLHYHSHRCPHPKRQLDQHAVNRCTQCHHILRPCSSDPESHCRAHRPNPSCKQVFAQQSRISLPKMGYRHR